MGWAARVNRQAVAVKALGPTAYRAHVRTRLRLRQLKARVKADALTDADHRILAAAGPETLAWIGYERKVTLQ